jgi:zinc transport system ATP-binding protein
MPMNVVAAENIRFKYNAAEVLSDISFSVEAGDYIGLVGPNGSGKTTLAKVILGFHRLQGGRVNLFGVDHFMFRDWRKIGYLPQKITFFNPYFPATVREIVSLGLISQKIFPKILNKNDVSVVDEALRLTDTLEIKGKLIGELSGGQQQRVLVARAIVNKPDLLILDEPTTALDPEARENFFRLLGELNKKRHVTIILITHDMGSVGKYASKLLYLDKKIIF